ncbi:unnamed protein product [Miscanthus lutarioriparius]|uniref:Tify domain-containing protein n=1 Tax=Miscanthus lutarioriparius TaxID=422564 RepID=A0A811Q7P1_9POAL|nr:unnamed protein product [Miscanthus lutarioriparius]
MQQPSSPSCTVAGGGAGGGGEDPIDGIVFPPELLRWLLNDDGGCLYRATMGAEAEASSRFRAAAPSPHSSMQQPSSPSRTVAGGATGGSGEEPFDDIVIPPEYLRWLLDDDDGFLYRATTAAEAEASARLRAAAATSSHSPMQRQPSSPSCTAASGGAGGGEEDPFDDILIPPDYLQGLDDDDDGCLHGTAAIMGAEAEDERRLSEAQELLDDYDDGSLDGEEAEAEDERRRRLAEAQACVDGGCVEDGLSMTYRGHTHVFDSVPPHKVETILMLLNGYELAPQSAKPKPTNLVHPIVVPQDFDRAVAMSRYRKKRKSTMKADYSVRREIALRIARRGGKFAPSEKSSENSVGVEPWRRLSFNAAPTAG